MPKPAEPPTPPLPIQVFGQVASTTTARLSALFSGTRTRTSRKSRSPWGRTIPSPRTPQTAVSRPRSPRHRLAAVTVTGNTGSTVTWSVTTGSVKTTAVVNASSAPCETGPAPPGPPAIAIGLSCVDNAAGTFSARFSYSAAAAATIPAGTPENNLNPAPAGQSPPSSFVVGTHAFTISGIPDGTTLVWTLKSATTETASATSDFQEKCNPPRSRRSSRRRADLHLGHVHRGSGLDLRGAPSAT